MRASEAATISERRRHRFGLPEMVEQLLEVTQHVERIAEGKPQIDGLLGPLAPLGSVPERLQSLSEVGDGFPVRRSRVRLGARLAQVAGRPVPRLAAQSVLGQQLYVLGQPVRIESLDGRRDPRVEQPPPVVQKTP